MGLAGWDFFSIFVAKFESGMKSIINVLHAGVGVALLAAAPLSAEAVVVGEIRFNDEASDTMKITEILTSPSVTGVTDEGERTVAIAELLLGTPYVGGGIEGEPEMLTIRFDSLDCTTFVETVLALEMTLEERRSSWHDFAYNLERLRYRGGSLNGYASRLHYLSDWIIDNSHRGNLQEVTERIGKSMSQIKTLDFMSRNRDKYPALADGNEFERMKGFEMGYRSHRYSYIKGVDIKNADIKDGDIIAITTKTPGLDVQHVGIAKLKDGGVYLIHASSAEGKVVVDTLPLAEYLRRNRSATGVRVVRLKH